jgi:hypothetical protein
MSIREMGSTHGQLTNNQKKRDRSFKTKEINTKGKTWVRDESYPVPTMVLRDNSKLKNK